MATCVSIAAQVKVRERGPVLLRCRLNAGPACDESAKGCLRADAALCKLTYLPLPFDFGQKDD